MRQVKEQGNFGVGDSIANPACRQCSRSNGCTQSLGVVKEFMELIARNPDEAKFYVGATETMLSAKRGEDALRFAEAGLAKARSTGNRDLEGACLELSEAAKRLK